MGQRRKSGGTALFEFAPGKRVEVMAGETLEQGMVGMFSLNEYLTRSMRASGTTAYLHQLLKQTLRGTEVRGVQRGVGTNHADQGQQRKIMTLRHHLGAHQNVGLTRCNACEQLTPLLPGTGRITVDPQDAGRGKRLDQGFLNTLGAAAKSLYVDVAAGRTGTWNGGITAAMMAPKTPVSEMHDKVGRAMRTVADPSTRAAGEHWRIAAPVQEHQALLAAGKTVLQCRQQAGRDALMRALAAEINTSDLGHDRGHCPDSQADTPVTPRLGVHPGFQRGGRRTQHDRHLLLPGPPDRNITRRVANPLLLFVGGVMLLVDQDQSQTRHRGEHGQPRAKNDIGTTRQRLHETTRTRGITLCGMQTDHLRARKALSHP